MVALKRTEINNALLSSEVAKTLLELIEEHPWNNMISLKTHEIFVDFLDSESSPEDKLALLKDSRFVSAVLGMSEKKTITLDSGNRIRNGYMGFVINLADKVKKTLATNKGLSDLPDTALVFGKEWKEFLGGEFEKSMMKNEHNLGGSTSTVTDDDEPHFEVDMNKIMQRFNCFNQAHQLLQSSTTDDDDDKKVEEEIPEEPQPEEAST